MNNLLRNVLTRRSIHSFDTRQIKDEELTEILEAGKLISTAVKNQPWHFTVIQNKSVLSKINAKNNEAFLAYGHDLFKDRQSEEPFNFLKNAPTLLIISGKNDIKYAQDAANTVFGSMMLAAEKFGIGSCWTHSLKILFDSKEGKEIVDEISLPPSYTPLCAGVFGYKEAISSPESGCLNDDIVHIIR